MVTQLQISVTNTCSQYNPQLLREICETFNFQSLSSRLFPNFSFPVHQAYAAFVYLLNASKEEFELCYFTVYKYTGLLCLSIAIDILVNLIFRPSNMDVNYSSVLTYNCFSICILLPPNWTICSSLNTPNVLTNVILPHSVASNSLVMPAT